MPEFFVTFGVQYAREPHPAMGEAHPDGWVVIEAADMGRARLIAARVLDRAWSMIYTAEDHDPSYYPRGELARIRDTERGPVRVIGPRTVTTAQEIGALPEEAVLLDREGDAWQRRGGYWCSYETSPMGSPWLEKYAPLTVLHEPVVTP